MKYIALTCHDCEIELLLRDPNLDIEAKHIKCCPCCGGTNIEVTEK